MLQYSVIPQITEKRAFTLNPRFSTFWTNKALAFLLCAIFFSATSKADSVEQATIAIVIDDLGHHLARGKELNAIPYPLTFAFLPERTYTSTLARQAYLSGKEVILHAPMENAHKYQLGAGALTASMNEHEISKILRHSLESIPFVSGMNNHMGSSLTSNEKSMQSVMKALSAYPYYFLDSRTTAASVAAKTAKKMNIPTLVRDIFLDHETGKEYIQKQFQKLLKIAKKKGSAIAIGHPYPSTITFLKTILPTMGEQGINVATLSGLWQIRHPQEAMFKDQKADALNQLAFTGEF